MPSRRKYPIPEIGDRYGRLTITDKPTIGKWSKLHVRCICDCGNSTHVSFGSLTSGNTISCGCFRRETTRKRSVIHGESNTHLFWIWCGIKNRCYNSNEPSFKNYGSRGISVCNEWRDNFTAFRDWAITNGYDDSLEIDRINNDGNYEPSNCHWVTHKENSRNTRRNHPLTAFGDTKSIAEWVDDNRCVVKYDVLQWRITCGHWNAEIAITTPTRQMAPL